MLLPVSMVLEALLEKTRDVLTNQGQELKRADADPSTVQQTLLDMHSALADVERVLADKAAEQSQGFPDLANRREAIGRLAQALATLEKGLTRLAPHLRLYDADVEAKISSVTRLDASFFSAAYVISRETLRLRGVDAELSRLSAAAADTRATLQAFISQHDT